MRLFFALFPDAATRERLSRAAAQLELVGPSRLVAPQNLHVTLAFVGDVPDGDLVIYRNMGATLGLRRCAIDLDSFEHWPNSQAIVLAAKHNPRDLAAHIDALRAAVAAHVRHGRELMRWRAHVTLARKVAQAPVLTGMSPVASVSQSFSLVRSSTGGNQSLYTVVESWPLLDEA